MAEIWKRIPSLPGGLASSLGRVILPPLYYPLPNGGYRATYPEPTHGVVAKSCRSAAHQYRHVMVRVDDGTVRQRPKKVHRLICEAFHGPPPFENAVVIHIDEDGLNNRPDNLKWGTQSENLNMPKFKEYCSNRIGDMNPFKKGRARKRAAG